MAAAATPVTGPVPSTHATAVIVGEAGVLIEGVSGSGKSALALALLAEAALLGRFGCLVGDDRVRLTARNGRLIAEAHPLTAGLIEQRGVGLLTMPHERACVVRLVVHLCGPGEADPPRLPDHPSAATRCGIVLPRLAYPAGHGAADRARAVWLALARTDATADFNGSNLLANSIAMHKIAPHREAGGDVAEQH